MFKWKEALVCCDPFQCHKKAIKKDVREISENTRTEHKLLHFKIGDKLCTQCRKRVSELSPEAKEQQENVSEAEENFVKELYKVPQILLGIDSICCE